MKLFNIIQTSFDNYDQTIRSYLSKTFNNLGLQYTHTQIFGVIFDGIKGIMQNMMFYIEDALNEQNIFTATRKTSIYSLAKISGYEAFYGSAARGTILCKLILNNGLDSKTTKIYIQNHTPITNKNTGVTYLIELPTDYYVVDVSKPLINHEFKIVQGNIASNNFVSEGKSLETFSVYSVDLFDKEYLKVFVDGVEYTQVANLYDMTENGTEYMCEIGYENSFDIIFGNGVYGKRLIEGQNIRIEYLKHAGITGNILPDEITQFSFSGMGNDVYGNNVDLNQYLILELNKCISGGTNSDSIEFIRNMVGKNSKSLVLASKDNFELFFKRFSFIGTVNCWSETNSMYIIASCTKNLSKELKNPEKYFELSDKKILLDEAQKEMIQSTLDNSQKSFAGITLKFEDPIIRKFAIMCYVKLDNVYERDIVKNDIKRYIALYFMNKLTNTQFIAKSDLVKYLLDNIKIIKSLDITFYSDLAESCYYNTYYYDYVFKEINGTFDYVKRKVMYESDVQPGLDKFGNISLNTKLEMPIISSIKYYPNKKQLDNKNDFIKLNPVEIYFI